MNHLRCRAKITLTISEERKKRVIDLYYNQGKTTREIAKIERMSIRDISPILKEEDLKRQRYKDQQQQEEVSSKAYELFSEGKKPIEVAITLNLREPEATKLYRVLDAKASVYTQLYIQRDKWQTRAIFEDIQAISKEKTYDY